MLDMTMPVFFAILIAVLALITVGGLVAARLIAERRSSHPRPERPRTRTRG